MQTLEDRTEKSRREMDLHDTIDTVRVLNARNQHVDIDKVGSSCGALCAADDPPYAPMFTPQRRSLQRVGHTTHLQTLSAAGDAHALLQRLWLRLSLHFAAAHHLTTT